MILITPHPRPSTRSAQCLIKVLTSASLTHSAPRYFSLMSALRSSHVRRYEAVVVGAGAAGIAVVGNLVEEKRGKILWVDRLHEGGRLNARYREVPSNTKVHRFIAYADGVQPFKDITAAAALPNAYSHLKGLDQEETCHIAEAADLCLMLADGLAGREEVEKVTGSVKAASWSEAGNWEVEIDSSASNSGSEKVQSDILVLCTGSSPTTTPLPLPSPPPKELNLDDALNPTHLATLLPTTTPITVAVIGASHSAILCLMNLYNLSQTTHPHLSLTWFTRHPLRYAEERGTWIYRDNTGLKGSVATWARANLEDDVLEKSPVGRVVRKVVTPVGKGEEGVYRRELEGARWVVQAVGFRRESVPGLRVKGSQVAIVAKKELESKCNNIAPDQVTGGFLDADGEKVKGLYGAGIAFPERVVDPEGNVEEAVGMWKFMSFLKGVVPSWRADRRY